MITPSLVRPGTLLVLVAVASKPYRSITGVSGLGACWTLVRAQCGGRNQTGVDVWSHYHVGGAVLHREARHIERVLHRWRTVVNLRKQVAMNVVQVSQPCDSSLLM